LQLKQAPVIKVLQDLHNTVAALISIIFLAANDGVPSVQAQAMTIHSSPGKLG